MVLTDISGLKDIIKSVGAHKAPKPQIKKRTNDMVQIAYIVKTPNMLALLKRMHKSTILSIKQDFKLHH